ncbi:glycoside hydrolase family 3 protein [Clostridium sp. AM58-1XD]|nr:glycoside hydrolase family 3 protein [Clostridium sp. AM58-1XD]
MQEARGRSRRKRKKRQKKGWAAVAAAAALILLTGAAVWALGENRADSAESYPLPSEVVKETFPGDAKQQDEGEQEKAAESGLSGEAAAGSANDGKNADLDSMSLEEKAAQIFMITPEALTGYTQVTQAGEASRTALEKYPVGGLIYFSSNLESPEQLKEMTGKIQEYSREITGLPLFLAIDEEGGKVARIANHEGFSVRVFDSMARIGESGDENAALEVGRTIGGYLSDYGFNMDFAPNADVLTNPNNQVIGSRSFGADPAVVTAMAKKVAQGLREQGVIPVYKHFPGHGATQGDTHDGFAYTDKTLDELKSAELVPFQDAASQNAECIMAAHIAAPSVTGDETPSSLSEKMITGVLRDELEFKGLVITDALNMGAIKNSCSSGEAAVKAVQAGADILLMPDDFEEAYGAVIQAVKDGTIKEERLNRSVQRILDVKRGMTG